MITGQIVFYSGIGLLAFTVILALIFLIKKPKYVPETATCEGVASDTTQRLRNGYPTDPLTIRREAMQQGASGTINTSERTEQIVETSTEPLPTTERLLETEVMNTQETEKLPEE